MLTALGWLPSQGRLGWHRLLVVGAALGDGVHLLGQVLNVLTVQFGGHDSENEFLLRLEGLEHDSVPDDACAATFANLEDIDHVEPTTDELEFAMRPELHLEARDHRAQDALKLLGRGRQSMSHVGPSLVEPGHGSRLVRVHPPALKCSELVHCVYINDNKARMVAIYYAKLRIKS